MDFNVMLLAAILVAAYKVVSGFKRGMVKEIISLVSLVILCCVVSLLANGIGSYQQGNVLSVVVVVILLALLGIVHHLLGVVFFSAKMIAKLPVVNIADKLLGAVFGVLEVVLFLWTIYIFTMVFNMGIIGETIISLTEDSVMLTWIYDNNALLYGIGYLLETLQLPALPTV